MSKDNKSEEDYLKEHLENIDNSKRRGDEFNSMIKPNTDSSRTTDLQYFTFDVSELPLGKFYPNGSTIMVRAAQVKEIQAYSMVDDNNFYDMIEKMNDMLMSCVRVKYSDGSVGSYMDIKDGDRIYLIFLIRELTFQSGQSLGQKVKCSCGCENTLEFKRVNFRFHEIDEALVKYFSTGRRSFFFETVAGTNFELTPPTIGLQKSFTDYIIKENNEGRTPNMSFLKTIPFTLVGMNTITYDGIKKKLTDYEKMDDISFQFLNAAVNKMNFGIKELRKKCIECGLEVHTDRTFPDRPSSIFLVSTAFDDYLKK